MVLDPNAPETCNPDPGLVVPMPTLPLAVRLVSDRLPAVLPTVPVPTPKTPAERRERDVSFVEVGLETPHVK